MARTIGRVAVRGENFFAATLDGYGRRWNYGVMHIAGTWRLADGTQTDDGVIVALGVIASDADESTAWWRRLPGRSWTNLDRRERSYDRVDVTELVTVTDEHGGVVAGPIYTYVPRPESIEHYEKARDAGLAGVRQTYWDLVDDAFAAFGDDQLAEYRTTPAPDIPLVEVTDAREV